MITLISKRLASTLLGDSHSATTTSGSLGVLTTHTDTPRVTQTTMDTNLLHALKVLTQLVVQIVGKKLAKLAILDILATIQEPVGNLVLTRILHDRDDAFQVGLVQFTGALGAVDLGLAADDGGVAATATTDGG